MSVDAGPPALILVAVGFAIVTGANDGGAILTMGLRAPVIRPVGALGVLIAGFVVAPLLFGTGVARTLSHGLVTLGGEHGTAAFVVGILAALAVVVVLTALGAPTSLTLAMIGGLAGAGTGYGLHVSWAGVGAVLGIGILAPLAGGAAGYVLAQLLRWLPAFSSLPTGIRWSLLTGYVLQCLAYGANDGQKVLAVFAVLAGGSALLGNVGVLAGLGLLFGLGVLVTLRRIAGRLGRDLLPVRSMHTLSAQLGSSAAVLGSAAVGVPVSMTQAVAAALVGAGVTESSRRVRWKATASLALAWVLTLPASVLVALAAAALLRASAGS